MKPLSGLGRECHGNIYFVGFFLSCKKGHEYSLSKNALPQPYHVCSSAQYHALSNMFSPIMRRYRAEEKYLWVWLSCTQAGPGRKVKQEEEEISRNHVPTFSLSSVQRRSSDRQSFDLLRHYDVDTSVFPSCLPPSNCASPFGCHL